MKSVTRTAKRVTNVLVIDKCIFWTVTPQVLLTTTVDQ